MVPRPTIAVIRIAGMYTAGDHIWETFVSGEPSGSGRVETLHGPKWCDRSDSGRHSATWRWLNGDILATDTVGSRNRPAACEYQFRCGILVTVTGFSAVQAPGIAGISCVNQCRNANYHCNGVFHGLDLTG